MGTTLESSNLRDTVELVAQLMRTHPETSDAELLQRCREHGVSPGFATQLIALLPIAYGRQSLADTNVVFSESYAIVDSAGEVQSVHRLDTLAAWIEAVGYARQDGEKSYPIASRSPEVRSVNALLLEKKFDRDKHAHAAVSPPRFTGPAFEPTNAITTKRLPRLWWQLWNAPAEHSVAGGQLVLARGAMILCVLVGMLAVGGVLYYAIALWRTTH